MIKKSKTLPGGIKVTAIVRDAEDITLKLEYPEDKFMDINFLRSDAKEIEKIKKDALKEIPKELKSLIVDSIVESADICISGMETGPLSVEMNSISGVKIIDKNGKPFKDTINFSKKLLREAKLGELSQVLLEAYNGIFGEELK